MSDQNRSGKGPMNRMTDDIDQSSVLNELERIGAKYSRRSERYNTLESRIREEGASLNSLLREGRIDPSLRQGPFYQDQVDKLRGSIRSARTAMNTMDASATGRAESEASTLIARQYTSTAMNAQIRSFQTQSTVQNRAFGMMGMSHDELDARRQDIFAQIRSTEAGALSQIKGGYNSGRFDPGSSATIAAIMAGNTGRYQEIAQIQAAMQLQRYGGSDPNSRLRKIGEMGQFAQERLGMDALGKEMQANKISIADGGGIRTIGRSDIQDEISSQARRLTDALTKLADSANRTDEELGKLRKEAEQSAENLDKLQKAGGGGGGFNTANVASSLGGMFNAAGGAIMQIGVNQRLGQISNIAGYAGIENDKYNTYRGARGGDVASQLMLSQYLGSEGFGRSLRTTANVAMGAYAVGGAAQTVAGIAQGAEGIKSTFNPAAQVAGTSGIAAQNILQGGQNIVQGVATTATAGVDIMRDVTGSSSAISGVQAQIAARKALMAISAEQLQGLRNFGIGAGVAAMSMGMGGEGFLNQTLNAGMDPLMAARMSPEQFTQMAQFGAQNMGSTFNSNQIFSARGMERSGFGSTQDNLARMAGLASAGSNNPQAGLGSVLEAAFSKGLDNSKVLGMVADNTAAFVQGGAARAMGFDTTAASAMIVTAATNTADPNKEFATRRSMDIADRVRQIGTDQGVNFSAMAATARLSRIAGIGTSEALALQNIDDAGLRTIAGRAPNEVRSAMRDRGINSLANIGDDKELMRRMSSIIEARLATTLTGGSVGIATGAGQFADRVAGDLAGGRLTIDQLAKRQGLNKYQSSFADSLAQAAGLQNMGFEEYVRGATGIIAKTDPNAKDLSAKTLAGDAGGANMRMLDDMRTSGFKQLSEAAKSAAESLGGTKKAMDALSELTKSIENLNRDGGLEKRFSTAAADSAGSFGKATTKLDIAADKLITAADIIINKSGISNDSGSSAADKAINKINSKLDSQSGSSKRN